MAAHDALGSLAIVERIKRLRPDVAVILGGISSTYYASELILYPFIDFVMRGISWACRSRTKRRSGGRSSTVRVYRKSSVASA